MIKVLIADDEPKIRKGIASVIDWESLGMEICAFAEDGEDALEKAKIENPDVCLVDICMPRLSGLDFINAIKEVRSDIICVVITGYDDFKYAKKAVSVGVYEYILKPVREKELTEILLQISKEINICKEASEKNLIEKEILETNINILKDHFLLEVIEFKLTDDIIKRQSDFYGIHFDAPIGVLRVKSLQTEEFGKWDEGQLNFTITNLLHEISDEIGQAVSVRNMYGQLCAMINIKVLTMWDGFENRLKDIILKYTSIDVEIKKEIVDDYHGVIRVFTEWEKEEGESLSSLIRGVKNSIEKNAFNPLFSVQELARAFNVNASHLSRQFKQEMGINNIEYITKVRMTKAVKLLESTDFKVYEIADKVGYTSQHYFCVAFKNYFGVSPSDYRFILLS